MGRRRIAAKLTTAVASLVMVVLVAAALPAGATPGPACDLLQRGEIQRVLKVGVGEPTVVVQETLAGAYPRDTCTWTTTEGDTIEVTVMTISSGQETKTEFERRRDVLVELDEEIVIVPRLGTSAFWRKLLDQVIVLQGQYELVVGNGNVLLSEKKLRKQAVKLAKLALRRF